MRKSNKNIRESRRLLEGVYVSTDIDDISLRDVLDIYLTWNGISGYTDDIMDIFENGEAWLSQADDEDLSSLKRHLGIRDITKESVERTGKKLTESDEIDRKWFASLIKYDVFDPKGNYAVLNDGYFCYAFWADNDEEAKKVFAKYGTNGTPEVDSRGKAIVEAKQLNEGPGAGYTISGKLDDFTINDVKLLGTENKDGWLTYEFGCDIDGTLYDVTSEAYYTGGKIDETPIKITHMTISAPEENEVGEPTEDDIDAILQNFSFETVYGGGWSHSKFANDLIINHPREFDYGYSEFDLDDINIEFTDPKAVDAIDKYATGDNYTVEYSVLDEDEDAVEFFDNKEKAIEYAQQMNMPYVGETHWGWEYLGNDEYEDVDLGEGTEIIWENEDLEVED